MELEWFKAARDGDNKRVAELLAEQPNLIEAKDRTKMKTALHLAAKAGHEAIVARLLAARPASLHTRDTYKWTALDSAASRGRDRVVAQMLGTPDIVGLDISLGLREAVENNHDKVVDLLLAARGPNFIISYSQDAAYAMHCMIERGDQNAFTRLIAIRPSLVDFKKLGSNALHQAARYGHDHMVSQILALRPQMIDGVSVDYRNVLMCAVLGGQQRTAEMLLAIKPEMIFHLSEDGETVLHAAVLGCKGDPEFVAKLWRLNPQALTNSDNALCRTPFHLAIESSNDELIELFQWGLSFDDIVSAFKPYSCQGRYRPVMERLCESLFVSLGRDVAGTVLQYVGIDVMKRVNKRKKFS